MHARLGVYNQTRYNEAGAVAEGIVDQAQRLITGGGHSQQDRIIEGKRKSLERALYYSYQAADIAHIREPNVKHKALINPNVTKQDYDDKILSTFYENNYKPGDLLIWYGRQGNKIVPSHWIIYLQDLTELAYFKGDIRKCNYYIKWENEEGKICGSWVAIRGPVETKINFLQKNGISLETPNHTLNILMPKTEETVKYFKRYNKFYLSNVDSETNKICWRVAAIDTVSMPGIIEINAVEYYANESEDADGVVGGKLDATPVEPDFGPIEGENIIKPKRVYTYEYLGNNDGEWQVPADLPLEVVIEGKKLTLKWIASYSGKDFILSFGNIQKKITVESLF